MLRVKTPHIASLQINTFRRHVMRSQDGGTINIVCQSPGINLWVFRDKKCMGAVD